MGKLVVCNRPPYKGRSAV